MGVGGSCLLVSELMAKKMQCRCCDACSHSALIGIGRLGVCNEYSPIFWMMG